jgi:hypothetical protein
MRLEGINVVGGLYLFELYLIHGMKGFWFDIWALL